jgi:hypothetical protein
MAKGINIFDSAKGKPKPSSSAKDKPTVEVDGIEAQLNELQNLKTQISNLETELDVVTDEIKTIAKEKFVELYLENGRNPNTFLLKDGSGCVMVIPTDKYISIKDEDRANQLIETYGEDIVTIDEKYYFNPEVLERNMKAIEKLIRDAKSISDADKQNLLIREVKYSVTKGTIDELYDYGEDMEAVINDIQPIITLKNCGGKMAEGGTDGEFIANVYDDYDAEVGTTVSSMYAEGGQVNYEPINFPTRNQTEESAKKWLNELIKERGRNEAAKIVRYNLTGKNPYYRFNNIYDTWLSSATLNEKYANGGMMANGGRVLVGKFDEQQLRNKEDKKAVEKAQKETGLKYIDSKIVKKGGKMMLEVYLISDEEYHNSSKFADGGMMAYAYGGKDYRIVGFYSDGFEEDLGNSNDLSEAIEMANAEQMQYPEYVSVKVLEVFGQKNSDYGDYEVIEYYSTNDKKALGGFFGNSRYNTGRSWHLDHARHNKKESYEKPLNKRSRRFKRK